MYTYDINRNNAKKISNKYHCRVAKNPEEALDDQTRDILQEEAEKILSTFMINNVYAQEDIFYEPTWFENLINAIMSIFGGGTSDTSSVIIEIPTIEDPFMNPDIDWDNPIIIDPRGFDDLFPWTKF